ncbi:hypothetical protein DFQ28_002024 [Apophysomyces sp. BC1034]|nr:hypothetical protein DFQ28_002024 [Apophysomyces sp. BC1034]
MAFDLPNTLQDWHLYMREPGMRQESAVASPPPKLPPRIATHTLTKAPAALASLTPQPTTFNDLPTELIDQIGGHVPIKDMGEFPLVNRNTYTVLREKMTILGFWKGGSRLSRMNDLQRAETIPLLAIGLHQFSDISQNARNSRLYAALLDWTRQLPREYQGGSAGALASVVMALPETERAPRYVEMRQLAWSLPDSHRCQAYAVATRSRA